MERRLFPLVAVGNQATEQVEQVEQEIGHTAVPGRFNLGNILQLVIDGLNNRPLAQPQLVFQAQNQQGQTYMVSHGGECHGECEYIAVPVNQKSLSEYKAGRINLRELMLTGGREVWYSARATGNPGELALVRQETSLSESPELPMKGFHHDHKFSEHAEP